MADTVRYARDLNHALEMVASGSANIISRVPISNLRSRAASVLDGLFDFDGTLTPGSQWRAIGELMPEELRVVDMENYRWYHSHVHNNDVREGVSLEDPDWWIGHLETGNKLAVDGAWIATTVYMLRLSGTTRRQIEEAASSLLPRSGVDELMGLMRHRAVVSFGIEQFILAWLKRNGLSAPVAATRLIFDERGRVDRPHINIVGAGSKEFAAARFRRLISTKEAQILVMGDTVVDIHMMGEESFNVLIVPPSELDQKRRDFRENNLEAMWNRLTMILANDSLQPLVGFITYSRKIHLRA